MGCNLLISVALGAAFPWHLQHLGGCDASPSWPSAYGCGLVLVVLIQDLAIAGAFVEVVVVKACTDRILHLSRAADQQRGLSEIKQSRKRKDEWQRSKDAEEPLLKERYTERERERDGHAQSIDD